MPYMTSLVTVFLNKVIHEGRRHVAEPCHSAPTRLHPIMLVRRTRPGQTLCPACHSRAVHAYPIGLLDRHRSAQSGSNRQVWTKLYQMFGPPHNKYSCDYRRAIKLIRTRSEAHATTRGLNKLSFTRVDHSFFP